MVGAPSEPVYVEKWSFRVGSFFTSFTGRIRRRRDLTPLKWGTPALIGAAQPLDLRLFVQWGDRCAHAVCRFP